MSLINSIRSAMTALQTTQAAFQVTTANVANVNTEGYSRKTVAQEPVVVAGVAGGVRLTEIQRHVDKALQTGIRE